MTALHEVPAGSATAQPALPDIKVGLWSAAEFELTYRIAKALAATDIVPLMYRSDIRKYRRDGTLDTVKTNDAGVANCMVALSLSRHLKVDPLVVMQGLVMVEGRISWSSQWVQARMQSDPRFDGLVRFDVVRKGSITEQVEEWAERQDGERGSTRVKAPLTVENIECTAWILGRDGHKHVGPTVSIRMAILEGWYTRKGSKWPTMPELMLRYRAATLLGRVLIPDALLGFMTEDEVHDIVDLGADGTTGQPYTGTAPAKSQPLHETMMAPPAQEPKSATSAPAAEEAPEAAAATPEAPPEIAESLRKRIATASTSASLDEAVEALKQIAGTPDHADLSAFARGRRAEMRSAMPAMPLPGDDQPAAPAIRPAARRRFGSLT